MKNKGKSIDNKFKDKNKINNLFNYDCTMGIIIDKSMATKYVKLRCTPFPRGSNLNSYDPYEGKDSAKNYKIIKIIKNKNE